MSSTEDELALIKARLTALERIVRVDSIQAQGDAVDTWWHVIHDGDEVTPRKVEAAGMMAAKEVLHTKNIRRKIRRSTPRTVAKRPKVK